MGWEARLDELAMLTSDWDGYGALPVDPEVIERVRILLPALIAAGLAEPLIVPIPLGGIALEWDDGSLELRPF